jgi:ankyrin repeat protein
MEQLKAAAGRRSIVVASLVCLLLGISFAFYSSRVNNRPFDSQLHRACFEGNIAEAQRLIDIGANLNLQGTRNSGDTPLMLAIASNTNCLPLARMLVAHGANVNLADNSGRTALDIAVLYGQIPVVQLLLEHGAKINAPDKEGNRPLSYAGVWTMDKPMKEFLLAHGAK